MKKLVMFFAAMAFLTVSFAQLNESVITNVQNPGYLSRDEWYGFTSNSSSAYIFQSEAEYLLRVPANDLTAGSTITKVMFQHLIGESFGFSEGDENYFPGNETYTIKVYTGTTLTPVTYIGSDEQEHTYDSLNPGVVAYSMNYSPTETGQQIVTLSAPFTIPAADFCVSIYAPDKSAGGLCPTDDACATQSFAYMDDEKGWWHYQFGNGGTYYNKPWYLAIYNHTDGTIVHQCDWKVATHDPDDAQTFPDECSYLQVDSYTDSIYLACEMGNMGPDTAFGHVYFTAWFECNGNRVDIIDNTSENYDWDLSETTNGYMLPGYGWWAINFGGIMGVDEMETLGLSYPFDLCINCNWVGEGANDRDPITDNNTYCMTISDQPAPEGIAENNSNLNVYPNPACNVINVNTVAGAQISIYNIAGQEVMAIEAANANESINVSNLSEGVYVVRVVNGTEVATSKVSIVR